MLDHQPSAKIALFDGAQVRLKIVGHPKPIFIADATHGAFLIGGSMYYQDGTPLEPADPVVAEIVPYQ